VHPAAHAVSQVYFKSADFLPPPIRSLLQPSGRDAPIFFSWGSHDHDPPRQIQIQTGSRGTVWCPGRQRYSVGENDAMPDAAARRSRVIRVTSWSIQTLHLESERECCLHLGICLGWHFPMFFLRTTKLFVYIVVRLLDRIQPRVHTHLLPQ
jgi:hypothetical protein